MKFPSQVLLLASASLATAQSSTTARTSTSTATSTSAASSSTATVNCDLPHLIVARGSSEPAGLGRIGVIAGNVTEKIMGATVEALDYPANFSGYFTSEPKGVSAMNTAVKSYLEKCANGKIVLMGYSQGAHVTADLVCGTSEEFFNKTADMTPNYQDNIVAVVLFGDPSHVANATFNAGTSTRDGIFPRTNIDACEPYIPKMRSWCDTGDIYCDSGNITTVHGSYFSNYTDEASDWVVEMWENFQADEDGDSTATGTATGTGGAAETTSAAGNASPSTTSSGAGNTKPVAGVAALAGLVALMW